jgi:L-asparaginase/Glu-tRNA(Gln) amidotransferase subunit D
VSGIYGTESGGKQLRESGILLAGDLPSSKARVKLMLALEYGDDPADISEYFP